MSIRSLGVGQEITTNAVASTNTTTTLTLATPTIGELSGNSPEIKRLYPRAHLRLQAVDTPINVALGGTAATAGDLLVSPNNPVHIPFNGLAAVPTQLSTFCAGGASKKLNVNWVLGDVD